MNQITSLVLASTKKYIPSNIQRTDILFGDRPYAGVLYGAHTLISSDNVKKQKLTTEFDFGLIGPASLAGATQTWVHEQIGSATPKGWGNQVKNDVILNYLIRYEKLLIAPSSELEVIGLLEANIGTLTNNLTAGLQFRAGVFRSYFSNYEKPGAHESASTTAEFKKYQLFFFMKPAFTAFSDNSTLQGGFFTGKNSVYTISPDDLTRFFLDFESGIVIGYQRLGIAISQRLRTAQYKDSPIQQYGNITLFVGL
jgi:lipid A 3-O-deacylase